MEPWRQVQASDAHEERRLYGLFPALVTNNKDPENRGRVRVRFPWLHESEESWWARVATFYAGKGRGSYLMPEVDDEVMVAFEHGDVHFPFVVGSVWNGVDNVPGPGNPDGQNHIKHFQSRSGHQFVFDDTGGAEKISLVDSSGKNSVVIDVAADTITVRAETGDIYVKAPSGKITVKCVDLNVSAERGGEGTSTYSIGNDHKVSAKTQTVEVAATQDLNVGAKMEQKTPTMIATIPGVFNLTSSNVKADIEESAATIANTTLSQSKAEKTIKQEAAEIGTYMLSTTSAQIQGQKLGVVAGGAHTVSGAKITAEGTEQAVFAAEGSMVIAGGLVVFKGSSVMVQGSV